MHDAKGRPLSVGDRVVIAAEIVSLSSGEDFCNVTVRTVLGRRPDSQKETISAINTGVLLRANPEDSTLDMQEILITTAAEVPSDG